MKSLLLIMLVSMVLLKNADAQKYSGYFSGEQPGLFSSAEFSVQNNKISGKIFMNSKQATVNGTVSDSASVGTVFDVEMSITYNYRSVIHGDELHFLIRFPELNDQEVELIMNRISNTNTTMPPAIASKKNNGKKDVRLVGIWRHTEVLSSGSGNNYSSFATDYFMEFKADGTVLSWTGKSAGGSGNTSVEGGGLVKTESGEWYTEGKTLFLIDPITKQKVSTLFYAEQNRMMLHNGGSEKKIFERIK